MLIFFLLFFFSLLFFSLHFVGTLVMVHEKPLVQHSLKVEILVPAAFFFLLFMCSYSFEKFPLLPVLKVCYLSFEQFIYTSKKKKKSCSLTSAGKCHGFFFVGRIWGEGRAAFWSADVMQAT